MRSAFLQRSVRSGDRPLPAETPIGTHVASWCSLLLLGVALPACSDPVGALPADAGTTSDVAIDLGTPPGDAPAADAPATTDAPATDAPATDAASACGTAEVLDLNALGTVTDGVLRYTGMSPMMQSAVTVTGCTVMFNLPRIFRYTAPAAGRTVFSTDNMGTTFDTTLAVLTACPGSGTSLGCVDDNGVMTRLSSIVRTDRALAAGETVYVVVGAFGMMPGTFALSVRTATEVAVGAACDADRLCVTGSTCIAPAMPAGAEGRCVADGSAGGACRPAAASGSRCDTGLACSSAERCITSVAAGGTCDPSGATNACVVGTSCRAPLGTTTGFRCAADGASSGACRLADPRCDTGLGCSDLQQCVPVVAAGGACGAMPSVDVCAAGSSCQTVGTGRLCVRDGAANGLCRAGDPTCDTGLGCARPVGRSPVCLMSVAVGAACDLTSATNVCVTGSSCQGSPGLARCVTDGVMGGQCRAGMGCDAGLGCNAANLCVTGIAVGGTCDPAASGSVCVSGSVCAGSPGLYRCVADGTAGGRCRASAPRCEAGLGCGAGDRCIPSVAVGAACDIGGAANVCVEGANCVTGATGATCATDGSIGGRCRSTATPCDGALGCGAGMRCITGVAVGGTCDPAGVANACVSPARCIAAAGGKARTCQLPSYVESEIASPTFVDACTADATRPTFATLDDALSPAVPLGFTLRAYGADYTSMQVSTNGMIVLGDGPMLVPPITVVGDGFPWPGAPRPVVAAFWDDLVLRAANAVCVRTTGTAPSRTTVIQWNDVSIYMVDTSHLTFELVLREGSNQIDFVYQTLNAGSGLAARAAGASAGIGVQGAMGTDSTRHAGMVTTTRGVRFAPR